MTELKTRDKSKKRAAILDGAIDVFIETGYELASMDRISEAAGVSKRTVYNHFGSKENLFQAVVEDFLSQRQNLKSRPYDPDQSLEEQLLAFARAEIFLIGTPRTVRISRFLTTVFLGDIAYARSIVAKSPPHYDQFLVWLEEAERDNRIRTDNRLLAARIFYALVEGAVTYPALFSDGVDQEAIKPLLDEIAATFLARYGVQK